MAPALVTEIVGTIVIDGASYLLQRFVDEVGNIIWRAFTDEDGDRLPDDPENPFAIFDEEPDWWLPFDSTESELPEDVQSLVIFMTPDGPVFSYNPSEDSLLYDYIIDQVTEQWVEVNGAMVKPFRQYTVSEAFLFIIAVGTIISLLSKIFKRRKM